MRELAALSEKRKISTSELLALIEELKYRRESKLREATRVKCESLLAKAAKRKPRSQLVYLESANPQTDIVSRPQRPEGALGDLERGSTLKERTLRHFAEDEAGLVKAPWWWWFANLTSIKILSGVEYQIVSSKNSEIKISLPLSDDFEFIFHDKLFYSRLEIRSDGTLLKGNLSKTQALLVKQYLCSLADTVEANQTAECFSNLFSSTNYVSYGEIELFRKRAAALADKFPLLKPLQVSWVYQMEAIVTKSHELRADHNREYIELKKLEFQSFFGSVEKSPLTDRQIEAILTDDDAVLVNAGAGTGKTSTVVGKIGFLVESGAVKPNEILALAYGRDAAKELRDRVTDRLGFEVEVRTFHSLGLELIQKSVGHRIEISDESSDERSFLALIAHLLADLFSTPEGKKLILRFISQHRYPMKFLEDFDSKKDYLAYMRKYEPYTLQGERVKSFEEVLIADWLTIHGVAYEYERPYEVDITSKTRRNYRPDFYLTDYGIYLEHFGVGRNGETAPGIDSKQYSTQIEWKRQLHKSHGTTLLETYSWQRREGVLFKALQGQLNAHRVVLQDGGGDSVTRLMETGDLNERLVSLLKDFLVAYKENHDDLDAIKKNITALSGSERSRAESFLGIFSEIESRYQIHLIKRKQYDFSDCIRHASKALATSAISLDFKRVIVDEYQDISGGRFNLLKQILSQTNGSRLMAVGDDWQSIYGFTGSDVEKSTRFASFFDGAAIVPLDRTFRFTKPIISVTSDFIQKNPEQLSKKVEGRDSKVANAVQIVLSKDQKSVDLNEILRGLQANVPKGKSWTVFLLGRYKFLEPKRDAMARLRAAFPRLQIEFSTIHASKGREADAVVILDLAGGRFGFPGSIERDPLMNLVISGEGLFPNAEERRVLYVALTRARSIVVISAREDYPSDFLKELLEHPKVSSDKALRPEFQCPDCSSRLFLRFPNRLNGYAWQCEHHPYCNGEALMCRICRTSPKSPSSGCLDSSCQSHSQGQTQKGIPNF